MDSNELEIIKEIYDLYSGLLDGLDPIGMDDEATPVIIDIGKKFDLLLKTKPKDLLKEGKGVGIVIYQKKDGTTRIVFDKKTFKKMFKKTGVIEVIPPKEGEVYSSLAIENWIIKGKKGRTAFVVINEEAEIQSIGDGKRKKFFFNG